MDYLASFDNKTIAVTGAAGTVGSELVRQLLFRNVAEVRSLDNNESGLFFLGEAYRTDPRHRIFLADVRDVEKIRHVFTGVDYVFHAAAFKHVPLCEMNPFDAVQTNILGVQNVIQAALAAGVKKLLFTSSDKAVNPTNVMGTSKLMGERLITAANVVNARNSGTVFASSRFGNVMRSRGSVIPLFARQIAAGGPVTLTSSEMTRFIMTLRQAVSLVLESLVLAKGGEVFVTKMPVVKITDLADVMIRMLAPRHGYDPEKIQIQEIGPRPGEKMYEELMNEEEIRRSAELNRQFVVLPPFRDIYNLEYQYADNEFRPVTKVYNSATEPPLSHEEIENILRESANIEGGFPIDDDCGQGG